MSAQVYCYVARGRDGYVYAATVDRPEWATDVAEAVAEWIKEGAAVERVTLQVAREEMGKHPVQASLL
jgi:hypothetical protein